MSEVTDKKRYVLNSEPLVLIPLAMFDALLDVQNSYKEEVVAEVSRAEEAEQRVMELSGELADTQHNLKKTRGDLVSLRDGHNGLLRATTDVAHAWKHRHDELKIKLAEADARCDMLEDEVEKYKAIAVATFATLSEQYCVSYQSGGGCREIGKCSVYYCPDIER